MPSPCAEGECPSHGPVAQRIERWFAEPKVAGSSPARTTSFFRYGPGIRFASVGRCVVTTGARFEPHR